MAIDVINKHIRDGFMKAGLTTRETLGDDEKVRAAAQAVHKQLPFAARTTLSVVLGKDSIETYALKVRDLVLKDMN
jgi:hypothetical protein